MKRGLIKSLDKLIAAVLAVLGITATGCESQAEMYGTPHANYQVKGTITAPDGQPVKGIQVKGLYLRTDSTGTHYDTYYSPTTQSDDNGEYALKVNGFAMHLAVSDPDGVENGGAFAPDTIEVPLFTSADSVPDNNEDNWDWYGNFEKTVDIQLKLAEDQPAEAPQP